MNKESFKGGKRNKLDANLFNYQISFYQVFFCFFSFIISLTIMFISSNVHYTNIYLIYVQEWYLLLLNPVSIDLSIYSSVLIQSRWVKDARQNSLQNKGWSVYLVYLVSCSIGSHFFYWKSLHFANWIRE